MTAVAKYFRTYFTFSRSLVQRLLEYRLNFFMYFIGNIIFTLVKYYLWLAIFESSEGTFMRGFSINEIVHYVFIMQATQVLAGTMTDMQISSEVKSGTIAMNLIRPISYKSRLFFEAIGDRFPRFFFVSFPFWIGYTVILYFTQGITPPHITVILIFLISLSLGFTVNFLFNYTIGLLAFWVTNYWGIRTIKAAIGLFLSGSIIPLSFFPAVFQKIFYFLPFQYIMYTPVMIYLEKYSGKEMLFMLGLQIIWIIILLFISILIWKRAIKRLTILGG